MEAGAETMILLKELLRSASSREINNSGCGIYWILQSLKFPWHVLPMNDLSHKTRKKLIFIAQPKFPKSHHLKGMSLLRKE
jgi:hypothetical protein